MWSNAFYPAVCFGLVLCAALVAFSHATSESSQHPPEGPTSSDSSSTNRPSNVVTLTDATFEHDTQAASGATTGDWLVAFYSTKCTPCMNLMPIWVQLGGTLKGKINVAKIDITENPLCSRRFSVKSVPMVVLFQHGRMYKYESTKERTYDSLLNFARSGYEKVESHAVPTEETLLAVVKEYASEIWSQTLNIHGTHPLVLYFVCGAAVLVGLIAGMILCWICKPDSAAHGSYAPSSKRRTYKKLD